jgi:hypothetical protein
VLETDGGETAALTVANSISSSKRFDHQRHVPGRYAEHAIS